MRKLAAGIAGAFSLIFMLTIQPWNRLECDPATCSMDSFIGSPLLYAIGLGFYVVIPLIVVGIIQVAVLGVRSADQPHDLAVRAALGETQRSAARAAALRGARDGAVWVGATYALGGVVQLAILATSGWPLWAEGELWLGRLIVAAIVTGGLVLAHVIDAARPRRTPVERLFEDAQPVRVGRGARRLGIALGVIAAVASGVIVGLALRYDLAPSYHVMNAEGIAQAVAIVAVLALALAVLIPAARTALPWWIGRVAGRVRGPAGAILASRARAVSRAGGRVVLVLGSFGFLLGAVFSANPAPSLSPTYLGFRSFDADIDAEAFAVQLREVEGVAGVVVPDARRVTDEAGNEDFIFAVAPAELAGLDDGLAEILRKHPNAVAMHLWSGAAHLHEAPASPWGFEPDGIVPITDCCSSFTSTSSELVPSAALTAFLIYSTDPSLNKSVQTRAWDVMPPELPDGTRETGRPASTPEDSWVVVAINLGILALLLGLPMVALAVGVVRARRSEDATLAALGSSSRAIRAAIVIETAAVSAFAMAVGLGLGAVAHAWFAALQRSRASLTGVITDSYLEVAIGSVAWVALGVIFVASVATTTTTAWVASRGARHELPAEQLRAAAAGRLS